MRAFDIINGQIKELLSKKANQERVNIEALQKMKRDVEKMLKGKL